MNNRLGEIDFVRVVAEVVLNGCEGGDAKIILGWWLDGVD